MKKNFFILFLIICFPFQLFSFTFYQDTANSILDTANKFYLEKDYKKAKNTYLKSAELFIKEDKIKKAIISKYNAYRSSTISMEPFNVSQKILFDALSLVDKSNENSHEVALLYSGLASIYSRLEQYKNSQFYCNKSIDIFNRVGYQEYIVYYYNVLISRGVNELHTFNFNLSKERLYEALEFARKNNQDQAKALSYLILLFKKLNEVNEIEKLLSDKEVVDIIEDSQLFIYHDFQKDIIEVFCKNNKFEKAIKHQKALEKKVLNSPFKVHFSDWFLALGYAKIYYLKGDYKEVINVLKPLESDDESRSLAPFDASETDLLIGKSYFNLNELNKAEFYVNKSLEYNLKEGISNVTTINDFSIIDFNLPEKLKYKSLLYVSQNVLSSKAQKINELCHDILKELGKKSLEDSFVGADGFKLLYSNILDSHWQKWRKNKKETTFYKALNFSDESRIISVVNEIKSIQKGKLFSESIPKVILTQEVQFNRQIDSLNRISNIGNDKGLINEKKKLLQSYETFKKNLSINHPKYFEFKYGIDKPIIDKLNLELKEFNVIEFFWGKDAIYIFNKYKDRIVFDKVDITFGLEEEIDAFIKSTKELNNNNYKLYGKVIYEKLFKKYIIDNARTIVVLDDKLNLLPIEAIWIEDSNQYLIEKTSFSRLNSIKQGVILPNVKSSISKSLLFAPYCEKGDDVNTVLPSSLNEVNYIASLFNSDKFLNEQANKKAFIEYASDYSIIHLATHSSIDPNHMSLSKIYFHKDDDSTYTDNYISIDELYSMSFKSNLVTLSSCETGIGKEQKGKGVLSLSNAFSYAGVSSTVMSLWKIPDKETSELMSVFYKNLKNGKSKDLSLQAAKLNYLNSVEDPSLKHPYFWAGFIMSGDTSPISSSNPSKTIWCIFGVILALIVGVTVRRKTKKKSA